MRPVFELRDADATGRIGELTVPRRDETVETPALLPVVNPHVQTIEPARLAADFGAEILITNAYILRGSDDLRDDALDRGVHDLLGFDGVVMTDSGSFQLAEYGEIDVTTEEILAFQRDIGSDIATPVDIPTPPDVDRERATAELETTQDRLRVAAAFDAGDMLVTAPVQGSTYPDLREAAGEYAVDTGLDVFPVGAMVPLLTDYRFADVADLVVAAKRGLGPAAPVHLFGAGHPMMFAFAAAMGCDLLDSAAYALFAREGRYLTVHGTDRVADLDYLPCECPVCVGHDPGALAGTGDAERLLAEHNLHVSYGELRRVKQAIRDGDLIELVEARARAHPALLDGYRALLDHGAWLERHDPVRKGAFFYVSAESARRPEVGRHHDRLDRLAVPDRVILATADASIDDVDGETWGLVPPFGPVPPGLVETTPLTAEVPGRVDDAAIHAAVDGVRRLAEVAPDADVRVAAPSWPEGILDRLRDDVTVLDAE